MYAQRNIRPRAAYNGLAALSAARRRTHDSATDNAAAIDAAARLAAEACANSKADDVVLLDLRGVTDMTDFFVIASGTSDTHVRSVAEHVIEALRTQGLHVRGAEGLTNGRWVVLDFVDFVVHVFHPTSRTYYQLERLWGDAPQLALNR